MSSVVAAVVLASRGCQQQKTGRNSGRQGRCDVGERRVTAPSLVEPDKSVVEAITFGRKDVSLGLTELAKDEFVEIACGSEFGAGPPSLLTDRSIDWTFSPTHVFLLFGIPPIRTYPKEVFMDVYSSHESAHPPDFVPGSWLAEFESDARRQVRYVDPQSDLRQWRPGPLWRLVGASPLVVILCMASLLWAVSIGSALALWVIGGLWLVSCTAAAVWVGIHLDAIVDAVSR